jgi:hypothetical protein
VNAPKGCQTGWHRTKKERAPLLERVQTAEFGAAPLFRHEHFLDERLAINFKTVEIDA